MNIIIPLGGTGTRFKNDGFTTPKSLINIFGKPMIFYLIDSLYLSKDDNLIIIYNKELNNYGFDKILKEKYQNINNIDTSLLENGNKYTNQTNQTILNLIELNNQTSGPTETVLVGLNNIDNNLLNNKCVLLDVDTFYNIDILNFYRHQQNNNLIISFNDIQDMVIFSYVKIDENNNVLDIREKERFIGKNILNIANTGCYCFENTKILKQYCEKVVNENIRYKDEFYISCVIKEMLKDNYIFKNKIINYSDFKCVGTPMQLKIFCSNFSEKNEKKRFCFDLDNTLVTSPQIKDNYSTVNPILKNIEYLRFLKKLGHYIIIYTERSMKTHKSNIGLVLKDISKITFDTLEKFNIPYDEIYFGKPYADFYIDDLAINAHDDLEKKIGIYKTSIQERDFNEIKHDKMDIIIKKSSNDKLQGEIYYYTNMPKEIKKYFPIFIDYGDDYYILEKINGITLSYLYVNESLSEDILYKYLLLINKIHKIHEIHTLDDKYENIENINIYDNYSNKIKSRYKSYDYSKFMRSEIIYNKLINYFDNYEKNNDGILGIVHGDAVFSNCIIDNNNNFKLIDMRGKLNNINTIYGDILYDYAKIYQSLIGYDEILLNKILSNDYKKNLLNIFISFINEILGEKYLEIIKMISNSLLFTLIPLHNNRKCIDFYNLINM